MFASLRRLRFSNRRNSKISERFRGARRDGIERAACESAIEILESRTLLSVSAFPNVNISKFKGNQPETAIAVDPSNPSREFAVSNTDNTGLYAASSSNGGATWSGGVIAAGAISGPGGGDRAGTTSGSTGATTSTDGLPAACCDPSAAFDSHGNLFLTYLDTNDNVVVVALSTDGGHTFSTLQQFAGDVDQPTVTTGPGSVWLSFQRNGAVWAAGASVSAAGTVSTFSLEKIPNSNAGHYADISVGPGGQVMVTWQHGGDTAKSGIFVSTDPDGLGPAGFSRKPVLATSSRVGNFDYFPAQDTRGADAEMGLAWDRSGGTFNNRAYLVYTDEIPGHSGNTDIFLRYSDNAGLTWSAPARVNDDTGINSQFFPRVSLDQTTGLVGVSWYDARDDHRAGGDNDTDGILNTDVAVYAALVTPVANGLQISPNVRVSEGVSNAVSADNAAPDQSNAIALGDYEGMVFTNGVMHPVWADNSNSTQDNPDGALKSLDVYTAAVPAGAFAPADALALGGLAGPGPVSSMVVAAGLTGGYIHFGHPFTFQQIYSGTLNPSTLNSSSLLITGPNGFSASPVLVKLKSLHHGTAWLATWKVAPTLGHFVRADDGTYVIAQRGNQIADTSGAFAPGGAVGFFAVGG